MSKTLLILLFAALCPLHAWSQITLHVRIKGRITDRDTQQPLADAIVTLLKAKDSSRVMAAFTDKNGAFTLEAPSGAYQLHITYIGYQQQLKALAISSDTLVDLGTIPLQRTGVTLSMVEIVELRAPMVVKKDTLEFNAGYYKTRENAVMEELLKKLPGIQIDKDGTIKINGQPVKRILVNGKPFFGDDPKLATRNLSADMIDKVQLIDQKSEQAQFSGVNDGQPEKMVNITTKKEKNDQFSGQLSAGYGSNDRYAANGSLNRFGKHPLSFLGRANNTSGVQETGMQVGGVGLARSWTGGINYNTDLNEKLKVNSSAYLNHSGTTNKLTTERQNLLPDTTYYYDQNANDNSSITSHISTVQVEYQPDTSQRITISATINYTKRNDRQESAYRSSGDQKQLVNSGTLANNRDNTFLNIATYAFWGKRFRKAGRTFSTGITVNNNTSSPKQLNRSYNLFIKPGGETLQDTIDQQATGSNRNHMVTLNMTYTEPVYKDHFLDAVYSYRHNPAAAERYTYDLNAATGVYDLLNDSLSNSFKNVAGLHQASISFRTQKPRYDYSIGLLIQSGSLRNNNISEHTLLHQQTTGFFPVAVLNYAFNSDQRLRFRYTGNTQLPEIGLLQPVPDNNNPLYIQLGNPDLKPAVTHSININYNTFNPDNFRNTMFTINATLLKNKVIMASWLDSLGRQVSQPLNANGAYNLGTNISNAFALKKWHTQVNTITAVSFSRDLNYTNGQPGNVHNVSVDQNISCNYTYKQLLDCSLTSNFNYNGVRYSQQKENNIEVFTYNFDLSYNITLPIGFNLGGNVSYQHNAGIAAGNNVNVIMLSASVAKNLFQHKQAMLKLEGFNLLNRNQGYSRYFGLNYVEDTRTQVLARFFLLSFTYFLKP